MKQNFMANGSTFDQASLQASKLMDGLVTKQAALLTYMDVFLWIGIFFLLCVPFVLILKPAKGKVDVSQAAH
jgi:DHA2 family multidrug resistance protein